MASGVAVFAGKAIATSVISYIINKAFDYLKDNKTSGGLKSTKERLERVLPQIQVVFDAVDTKQTRNQSEALDAWLWQLRDAVEEAEDALDDLDYYKLEEEVKSQDNKVRCSLHKYKGKVIQQVNHVFNSGSVKRLRRSVMTLDEVAAGVDRFFKVFHHLDNDKMKNHKQDMEFKNWRQTSSLPDDGLLLGREEERKIIVDWLTKPESDAVEQIELHNFCIKQQTGYTIGELKNLKKICHLYVSDLNKVKSAEEAAEVMLDQKENLLAVRLGLTDMMIGDCAITSLPSAETFARLKNLKNLCIWDCKELVSINGIQGIPSLISLQISGCSKMTADSYVEMVDDSADLPSLALQLDELDIDNPSLLLRGPLRSISCVKKLRIVGGPELRHLPEEWLLQNQALKELEVSDASHLICLAPQLANMSSIESFHISNAKLIQSLPGMPISLRHARLTLLRPRSRLLPSHRPNPPQAAHPPRLVGMACSHLAAASSSAATATALRSRVAHPAASFARLPATLHPENGGLALRGRRAVAPVVVAAGPAAAAPVAGLDGRPAAVKQPIIVIDNYDSFTYNLCQYMGELGLNFEVYRNDELTIEDVKRMNPRGILISPGPGEPQDSGISLQTVLELGPTIPIFGVCMGLQCIGEAFGGKIIRVPSGVMHGKSSPVYYDEVVGKDLFEGLANPFTAARYHSLVIEKESFPHDALEITAWTEDGLVMAARHKKYKHIQGVQFHPESIITPEGKRIILNFARFVEEFEKQSSEGK
ncbi:hypothetical protein ACQ4PT_047845 [Festuca glaucescens]